MPPTDAMTGGDLNGTTRDPRTETVSYVDLVEAYLADVRPLVAESIRGMLPAASHCWSELYEPMLEYPERLAKGLRPAICIATCRALGGTLEAALPSAAVIELYHNAFLIHDDIEDGSELRRGEPTLHAKLGMPIAVNVGDAMLATALRPLLDNMATIGMGKALRVLRAVAEFARESAEGQAIELAWIRTSDFAASDDDYLRMVEKKTSQYSFVAPLVIGGIIAGAPSRAEQALRELGTTLGAAFQITDDVLNLTCDEAGYGKESMGDLWEGKHTLVLLHAIRNAPSPDIRARMVEILSKPRGRPSEETIALVEALQDVARRLARSEPETSRSCLLACERFGGRAKEADDVVYLRSVIDCARSIEHAATVARGWVDRARDAMVAVKAHVPDSVHARFLEGLVSYVIARQR